MALHPDVHWELARARQEQLLADARGWRTAGLSKPRGVVGPAPALFAAMFAGQAAVIAMGPVLDEVAAHFGVATATVGQLRTLSGLVATIVGFQVTGLAERIGLRAVLGAGTALLAVGALASAAAPSFVLLAAAHVLLGAAIGCIVAISTAAAGVWAGEHERTRVLSWALIGQPAAWIAGMPILGAVGAQSWRLCWLVLPLGSAVLATLLLMLARPSNHGQRSVPTRLRAVLTDRALARWGMAELLFNCGWSGTLVYAGTLFADTYDSRTAAIGLILGGSASLYLCGNLAGRRLATWQPHRQLVALALLLSVLVAGFGTVRHDSWTSATLLAVSAFIAGCRALVGSAVGLAIVPEARLAAMGLRTAAVQTGGVLGTGIAGVALATGGYAALGLAMAAILAAAAAALLEFRVGVTQLEALTHA
jgi:DHA1 family inner membrane transport protein